MAFIEFKDVSFQYPNGFSAVEGVDFEIQRGESIAVVGQNGAGKTTMVKMVNGLIKPTSGTVIVDGNNTKDFTTAQLSRKSGYVFQNPDDQIFHNTVINEIEFGSKVLGFEAKKIKKMTQYAAELVGLSDKLEENPYNLPFSTRKFVTIAAVLAMDTDIIILDEPTAGQDLKGMKILEHMLDVLSKKGKTLITITHDMEFVVNNFEKVFVMAHKNLLKITTPKSLFQNNALLETSMLKKAYVSQVAYELGIKEEITTQEELVEYLKNKIK